ncbi:hypothetical protein [Paractinoplanes durhamensis]|uniref:Uncharacterized protein n=1 Tax=Paractinoplanes durhamensis TaxID=113563 RepID=A0ABQ3Z1M7_9ACTN|nr:hypothetical protein [Actinoplanes durhamensis]GIE03731.1 hypothetical protein Adu01nite_50810 [Actinoplanes durhamensis]
MTTLSERFPEIFPPDRPVMDHDSDWFAQAWLHQFRRRTARTVPVIAVVRELAATLRDDQIPAPQALRALRRAVSLLTVLAGSDRNVNRQVVDRGRADLDDEAESDRLLGREAVSRPGESTRFAKAWLLASPSEVIRTEPVIALVEQLLDDLITKKPTVAYASLRQAVQVLNVFARENENTTGTTK